MGKPARTFVTINLFINRASFFQPVIKWAWLDRTTRKTVEMRERDFMAQAIIFLGLDDLPFLVSVAAETTRIKFTHRNIS